MLQKRIPTLRACEKQALPCVVTTDNNNGVARIALSRSVLSTLLPDPFGIACLPEHTRAVFWDRERRPGGYT